MTDHLYIIDGTAVLSVGPENKVQHILGKDPFAGAPSWVTCVRQNKYLGFCWCDMDVTKFACISPISESSAINSDGNKFQSLSAFSEVVATRLVK